MTRAAATNMLIMFYYKVWLSCSSMSTR